ncbi:hypothetical protein HET69_24720 [Streptomyces sp. CJ_13]|uniref:DUF7848 domain-containing protein n=1 Tax=Streptomyces sp. CJ_13 TaxID=2724943 RepID=UPI001BDCA901|nr:hypothetical protein [Streptomyces sp. CJ_13]MBT1187113.1 hypothetical protein [Streptomyces sp. CJ_13]
MRQRGRGAPVTRSVIRYAEHRIVRDPECTPSTVASCLYEGCGWAAVPGPDVAEVDRQCMKHTGLNAAHGRFLRGFEDIALVHRVDAP